MMLEDIAQHAHQRIQSNGGVTINLQGHEPDSGYAFSPYPELERVLPHHAVTPDTIHQYLTDNQTALSMPGNHLGAWHDQQSGNVFLDVSHVGPAHPDTIKDAAKANQLAVFDLSNFNEIPTGVERSRDVTTSWVQADMIADEDDAVRVIGQPAYDAWQFSDEAQSGHWTADDVIAWADDAFKLDSPEHSLSYTREAATRLNSTFEHGDGWQLVGVTLNNPLEVGGAGTGGSIQMIPRGSRPCTFHPDQPAVAVGGFAAMCPSCLTRYQHAILNTNQDMRVVHQQDPNRLATTHTAWELPENYGWLGPQTLEEHALISQPHLDSYVKCPSCGAYTKMPLGGCPHCGYHPEHRMARNDYAVNEYSWGQKGGFPNPYGDFTPGQPFLVDHKTGVIHLGPEGSQHAGIEQHLGYDIGWDRDEHGMPRGWISQDGKVNFGGGPMNVWHGQVATAIGRHKGKSMPLGVPYDQPYPYSEQASWEPTVREQLDRDRASKTRQSWIESAPAGGDDFIHDLDSQGNGDSGEFDQVDPEEWTEDWSPSRGTKSPSHGDKSPVNGEDRWEDEGGSHLAVAGKPHPSEEKPLPKVTPITQVTESGEIGQAVVEVPREKYQASTYSHIQPGPSLTTARLPRPGIPSGAHVEPLTELVGALGLDRWAVHAQQWGSALPHSTGRVNRPAHREVGPDLTDNRPSCKEFLMSGNIRESTERAAEGWESFSNIPARSPDGTAAGDSVGTATEGWQILGLAPRVVQVNHGYTGGPGYASWVSSPGRHEFHVFPGEGQGDYQIGPGQYLKGNHELDDLVPYPYQVSKGWGWQNAFGKVAFQERDYFHYAPTEDRARIQAHGLIPAPQADWGMLDENAQPVRQPTGVYVSEDPVTFARERFLRHPHMDLWRVPGHHIMEMSPDPMVEGAHVIPHSVRAILHEPYENTMERWGSLGSHIAEAQPRVPVTYNHNTCPRCGASWPTGDWEDEGAGVCPKCGYDIPYDGAEILDGWHNPYQWAQEQNWTWEPQNMHEDDGWGPRNYGSTKGWSHFGSPFDGTDLSGTPGITVKPEVKPDPYRQGTPTVVDHRPEYTDIYDAGHGTDDHPYFWDLHNNVVHLGPHDWYHDALNEVMKEKGHGSPYAEAKVYKDKWALGRSGKYRGLHAPVYEALRSMGVKTEDDDWDISQFSKVAKETFPQKQRKWEELSQEFPDRTEHIATTPEGYTIHRLPTYGDVSRTGLMLHNCWRGLASYSDQSRVIDPNLANQRHVLNDEHGHPAVAFFTKRWADGDILVHEALGRNNKAPKPEHLQALQNWAASNGFDFEEANYENPLLHEASWQVVGDYYHQAPTTERARILQHGLMPGKPLHSERWTPQQIPTRSLKSQPEGVYVTDHERGFPMGAEKHDTWRIPEGVVEGIEKDKRAEHSWIIPHRVDPVMHQRWEDSDAFEDAEARAWFDQERLPGGTDAELEPWQMHFEWAQNADKRGVPANMQEYMRQKGVGFPTHVMGKQSASPHSLVWEPGWPGKGIYHNGELTTWGVNNTNHKTAWPHHVHMWKQRYPGKEWPGLNDPNTMFLNIDPEGEVRESAPFQGPYPEEIHQIDPRLKKEGEFSWANEFM